MSVVSDWTQCVGLSPGLSEPVYVLHLTVIFKMYLDPGFHHPAKQQHYIYIHHVLLFPLPAHIYCHLGLPQNEGKNKSEYLKSYSSNYNYSINETDLLSFTKSFQHWEVETQLWSNTWDWDLHSVVETCRTYFTNSCHMFVLWYPDRQDTNCFRVRNDVTVMPIMFLPIYVFFKDSKAVDTMNQP